MLLYADDVPTREELVTYNDSYTKAMDKYGLQHGVCDSKTRQTTTARYYRDLKRQTEELEVYILQLHVEQQETEKRLENGSRSNSTNCFLPYI